MVDDVPIDQRAANVQESQVYVPPPLVLDAQAQTAVEPRQRALDNPAMSARPFAALDATPGAA